MKIGHSTSAKASVAIRSRCAWCSISSGDSVELFTAIGACVVIPCRKYASLTRGTFTVSNMGMMNVDNFIAIINPPETAILSVASIRKKLMVSEDNTMQIRDMVNMTLSADHRAVNGVDGGLFSTYLIDVLADIRLLLL